MTFSIEDSNIVVHKPLHEYVKYDYLLDLELYVTSFITDNDVLFDLKLKDYYGNIVHEEDRNYRIYLSTFMREIKDKMKLKDYPFKNDNIQKTLKYFSVSHQNNSIDEFIGEFPNSDEIFNCQELGKVCISYSFKDHNEKEVFTKTDDTKTLAKLDKGMRATLDRLDKRNIDALNSWNF